MLYDTLWLSAARQKLQILHRKYKYSVRICDSVVISTCVCSTEYLQVSNSCQTSLGDTLEFDSQIQISIGLIQLDSGFRILLNILWLNSYNKYFLFI